MSCNTAGRFETKTSHISRAERQRTWLPDQRYTPLPGLWGWLMPFFFVASHGSIYEIIEWIAALIVAPDLGNAYLGTQGDPWDAQWDMAWATAGAALSLLLLRLQDRLTSKHDHAST
jgi:putative membrane protein